MALVVTGYVPLPCGHRTSEEYAALGGRLMDVCRNAVAFRSTLANCWLAQVLQGRGHHVSPAGKDSAAYHCVQHEKTAWLAKASRLDSDATLVWLDYGLLHLPSVRPDHVVEFLRAIAARPPNRITAPGCYPLRPTADDRSVDWSFCGGVLALPSRDAAWFHDQCVAQRQWDPPTWEVNTWAAVARRHPDRFAIYMADHNETMLTRYPSC